MIQAIDVVIVNHNSTDHALKAIESIKRGAASVRTNIFVVDNASEDQPKRIEAHFSDTRLLRNNDNVGFAKAINMAFERSGARYVMIMNPDTLLINGFFPEVLNYLDKHRNVGVVGPMVLEPNGEVQGSARRFPTIWSYAFGRKSPLTRLFPGNPITRKEFVCFNGNSNKEIEVDWVSGACMIVRRRVFEAVGGFDERFFLYWEDTDFCKRIRKAGWRVIYFPKAEICHFVGVSSSKKPFRTIVHFHHSSYKLFSKHSGGVTQLLSPLVIWALFLRCLFVIKLNVITKRFQTHSRYRNIFSGMKNNQKDNHKIKVLRIISRLNIGGPSIHVTLLSRNLNPGKFETKLITGSVSPSEGDMSYLVTGKHGLVLSIPELQREIQPVLDTIAFFKLIKIIIKEKPSIVHTHTAKAGAVGRMAGIVYRFFLGRKIALVHTFHGNVFEGYFGSKTSRFYILIERFLSFFTDVIIAISPAQKVDLAGKYKIAKAHKVQVINLGFDLSRFVNEELHPRGAFRDEYSIKEGTVLIGIVGRLVPIKNHHMFLDAAKHFMANNQRLPVRFVVVGDGELREDLEQYAQDLGIRDHIIFVGWKKEIVKVYADLDVLALTSINEGTPVSIIEAMAMGVPVITTQVGATKDLLGEPRSTGEEGTEGFKVHRRGIMCPSNDPVAFAKGLGFIVNNEQKDRAERLTEARRHVREHYSRNRLVRDIETLYTRLSTT